MNLVWSLVGIMVVWTCLKFVFLVFKRLGSKNSMNDFIDRCEEKMNDAAETTAKYAKQKRAQYAKKKEERERPIVTIR